LELRARASADSLAAVAGVRIEAPARLHLGFVDLHGGLGRRFGSLGLALEDLGVCVRVSRADATSIEGPGTERVREVLTLLRERAASAATCASRSSGRSRRTWAWAPGRRSRWRPAPRFPTCIR
jgi:hypothetical protein